MKLSDFYFDLPKELIAQTPIEPRDHSRLLILDRATGEIIHKHFYDLPTQLEQGDLLILNDSRVLPARLYGKRIDSDARIEFLLLEQKQTDVWEILVRPGKKARVNDKFVFGNGSYIAEIVDVFRRRKPYLQIFL